MALGDDIDILGQSDLFSLFSEEALRLLAFAAEYRIVKAGDVIFRKGDRADGGYILRSGTVTLDSGDGQQPVTVGPGALIGRLALFIRNTRPVTATAVETADLVRISPTLMRRVLGEFPACAEIAYNYLLHDLEELAGSLEQVRLMLQHGE